MKDKMKAFKSTLKSILIIAALAVAIPLGTFAEEAEKAKKAKKERTLKGVLSCAKCSLKKTESCQAALTTKRKNKQGKEIERVLLLKNNEVAKAFHGNICSGDKVPVAVKGVREGRGKKMIFVASKIEKAEKKKFF